MSKKSKHNRMNPSEAMGILNCSESQITALINSGDVKRYPSGNKAGYTVNGADVRQHHADSKKWESKLEINVSRGGITKTAPATIEQGEGIFFSFGEVARQLDRTPSLVTRWIKNMQLPIHTIDGYKYIDGLDLSTLQKVNDKKQRRNIDNDNDDDDMDLGGDVTGENSLYISSSETCKQLGVGKASVWALGKNGTIQKKKIDGKPFFLRSDVEAYRPAVLNIKGMEYWPAETASKIAKVKSNNLYNKTATGEWKGVKHNGRCYYSKRDIEQYCRDKGYDDTPTVTTTTPEVDVEPVVKYTFVNTLNPGEPEGHDTLINAKQSGTYMGCQENPFIKYASRAGMTVYRYDNKDMYRLLDVESLHYDRYKGKHTITQNGIVFISEPLAAHLLSVRPSAVSCTADKGKFEMKIINYVRMYNHLEVLKYKNDRRPSIVKCTTVLLSMADTSETETKTETEHDPELRRSVPVAEVEQQWLQPAVEPAVAAVVAPVATVAPEPIPVPTAPVAASVDKLSLIRDAMIMAPTDPEMAKLVLEALKG